MWIWAAWAVFDFNFHICGEWQTLIIVKENELFVFYYWNYVKYYHHKYFYTNDHWFKTSKWDGGTMQTLLLNIYYIIL